MIFLDSCHFLEQPDEFMVIDCCGKEHGSILSHLFALLTLLDIILHGPHGALCSRLLILQLLIMLSQHL